jgi:hypothetical protein
LYVTILYAISVYMSFLITLHSILYVIPLGRFSLHVLYPTLNLTGVPIKCDISLHGLVNTHIARNVTIGVEVLQNN